MVFRCLKRDLSCDPLLCSVFELNNSNSPLVSSLAYQVYLAHEAYYNATQKFVAFGEGDDYSGGFIVEWVVLVNGTTCNTWNITQSGSNAYLNINPIIYTKIAYSFLSLYQTTFARSMVIYLEQTIPDSTNGYSYGASNNGTLVSQVGSNTNGLILDAALYYIQNNP